MLRNKSMSEAIYYRRKKEYASLHPDQAKRLKELEKDNNRLKKLLTEVMLDNQIRHWVAFHRLGRKRDGHLSSYTTTPAQPSPERNPPRQTVHKHRRERYLSKMRCCKYGRMHTSDRILQAGPLAASWHFSAQNFRGTT